MRARRAVARMLATVLSSGLARMASQAHFAMPCLALILLASEAGLCVLQEVETMAAGDQGNDPVYFVDIPRNGGRENSKDRVEISNIRKKPQHPASLRLPRKLHRKPDCRVLILGDSYSGILVHSGLLHRLLQELFNWKVNVELYASGAANWHDDHVGILDKKKALFTPSVTPYDAIVLQEQSQIPGYGVFEPS
eukprot:scaffold7382_cov406-Prasinococcus_capsulatus_cf.AAC.7